GETGNDTVLVGSFSTGTVDGGAGNDSIHAGAHSTLTILGGTGDDSIVALTGDYSIVGGDGNAPLFIRPRSRATGRGRDTDGSVQTGATVTIIGPADDELIQRGDSFHGSLDGGAGNDTISVGQSSTVSITGGTQRDSIFVDDGSHATIDGGAGN